MTDYVQEPSRYWVEADRQGDPSAPRWFQMTDGQLHPVTQQVADWICRAWEHDADADAQHAARDALDARIEQHNLADADLERRVNDLAQREKLAINGKRGWWNPLGVLDIPSDLRELKQVQAEAPELVVEGEQMAAVADQLNARSAEIDTWADRINTRLAQVMSEKKMLGNPPYPQEYPHFAFTMMGRSPQRLTPQDHTAASITPVAGYQAPPIYQAPPEPVYDYPAAPQPHGTSPTPQPAQQPAAAPNQSSSNVFDDLI